jgi:prevent-host-death family protein
MAVPGFDTVCLESGTITAISAHRCSALVERGRGAALAEHLPDHRFSQLDQGGYRGYFKRVMNVGTKELKNRLSHYLRKVKGGEVVRVTDRGEVVAEIRAVLPVATDEQEILAELEADGLVTTGRARFASFRGVRLRKGLRASRAILEDRG